MSMIKNPLHPGEILDELFLTPLEMSSGTLAKRLDVPRTRIERLLKGDTSLTADTAIRLSTFFGNTPEFWLNMQRSYDLAHALEIVDVSHIEPLAAAQALGSAAGDLRKMSRKRAGSSTASAVRACAG